MGYEDLNDHEELRHNPMFALALQKRIGLENEPVLAPKLYIKSDRTLSGRCRARSRQSLP